MPLIRYEIRNEHSLANPQLYKTASKDDPEGLLEGVAMAGLVGIVRQLGDLAEFAADIFRDLHEEVMATASRGHELLVRVQQLEAEMPAVEKALLSETNQLRFAYTPGAEWHASIRNDQNHCTQGDLPRFIRGSYEECRGPPRLFKLDKFDVAGAGACLKRYTDPSFFRTEWASSELMKAERAQRDKRARREKKGRRRRNLDDKEGIPVDQLHARFNPDYSKELAPPGADQLHPRMWQLPVADREQSSALENLDYNPSIGFKPPAEAPVASYDPTRGGASSSSLQRLDSDNSTDGPYRLEYQSSMEGLQRLDSHTSAQSRMESQTSGLSRMDSQTSIEPERFQRLDSHTSALSRVESQTSGFSRMDSQTSMEPERSHTRENASPPRHDGLYRVRDKQSGDVYSEAGSGISRKREDVDYSEDVVEEKPQLSPSSPPSPQLSSNTVPTPAPQLYTESPKEDVKDGDEAGSDADQFVDALATMDSEVESDSEPRARNNADTNSDRMSDAKDGSVSPLRDEVKASSLHSRGSSTETLTLREQHVGISKKSHSRGSSKVSSGRLSSEKLDMIKVVSPPPRIHIQRNSESGSSSSSSSSSSSPTGADKQGQSHEEFAESQVLGSVSSFNSVSGVKVSKMIAEIEKRTLEQIQDDERREQEREEEMERQRTHESQLELQKEQERLEALEVEKQRQEELRLEQMRKEEQLQEELRKERIRQEELRREERRKEQARQEEIRKEQLRKEELERERIRQEKIRMEQIRQEEFRREQARREELRREQARLEQLRVEQIRREQERRKEEQRLLEERLKERRQEEERQRQIKVSVYSAKKPQLEDPRAAAARQSQEEFSARTLPPLSRQSDGPPTIDVEVPSPSSSPMSLSSGSPPDSPVFSAFHSLSPIRTSRNVLSSPESRPSFVSRPGCATEMMSPTSPVPILALSMSPTSRSGSPPLPPLEWPGVPFPDSPTSPSRSFNKFDIRSPSSSPKAPTARSFDSQTEQEAKSSSVSPKVGDVESSVPPRAPEMRSSSTSPVMAEVKSSSTSGWEPELTPSTTSMEPGRSSNTAEKPHARSRSSSPKGLKDSSPSTSLKESAGKSSSIVQEPEATSGSVLTKESEVVTVVTRGQDPYPSVRPAFVSLKEPEVILDSPHVQKPEVKLAVAVPEEPEVASVSPRAEGLEVAASPVPERPTPGRPSPALPSSSSSSSEDEAPITSPKLTQLEGREGNLDENAHLESAPSEDSDFSPPVSPTSSVEDFSTTVAGKLLADFSSAIPSSENLQEIASVSRAIFKKDLLLPQSESESEPELSPSDPQKFTSDDSTMPGPSRLSDTSSSSTISYNDTAPYNDVPPKAPSSPRSTEDENLSTALVSASPPPSQPAPTTFDLDPILKSHYDLRLSPPFMKSDSSSALKPPRELPPLPPVRTSGEQVSSRPLLLPPPTFDPRTVASGVSTIPPAPAPPSKPSVSFRGSPSKLSPPGARPLPDLPAPTPPTKNQGGNGEFNPQSQRKLHELPHPPPPPSRPFHELPPPPLSAAKRGAGGENVQDALLEAIASHDRNQLKKVKTMQNPALRKLDDRSHLLEQIRAQSFNLRHTVVEKAEPPPAARPAPNINVAAILEKASAIRQAFAGSDEDDDDEDEWSDIPRKD